jgi:hypothetical protein
MAHSPVEEFILRESVRLAKLIGYAPDSDNEVMLAVKIADKMRILANLVRSEPR